MEKGDERDGRKREIERMWHFGCFKSSTLRCYFSSLSILCQILCMLKRAIDWKLSCTLSLVSKPFKNEITNTHKVKNVIIALFFNLTFNDSNKLKKEKFDGITGATNCKLAPFSRHGWSAKSCSLSLSFHLNKCCFSEGVLSIRECVLFSL